MADKSLRQSGIYCIRNIISGHVYVGSSIWIETRWSAHRSGLTKNLHRSKRLQASWNKDGPTSFVIEILESVPDKSYLIEREQFWIDKLNSACPSFGFNIHPNAAGPLGSKLTEEARAKISMGQIGRVFSEETKAKISAAKKGKKLPPQSLEHRTRISAAKIGVKKSPETKARMSESRRRGYSSSIV